MNIDTMRRIDRIVGMPLCLVVTWALRLWTAIRPSAPRPLKRILFIELSETGSAILADPAMRKACDRLDAEIYFAIFAVNAPALDLLGTVPLSNVFSIRSDTLRHLAVDTLRYMRRVRAQDIDTVVDLECFSRYSGLLTGLSGADRRVGFDRFHDEGLYRGDMLTHRVVFNPHIHIAKNFIALVNALLFPDLSSPYSKTIIEDAEIEPTMAKVTASARTAMLDRVCGIVTGFDPARHRIVLVNPNASDLVPQRRWMPERFAELIRSLLERYEDAVVLITGAPGERDEAAALAAQCRSARCVSLAGHTALGELPALYALSIAMVTNDSGPGHFASITSMPTIVLFGPETPKLYAPLGDNKLVLHARLACSPCIGVHNHRMTACTDNVCMKSITVDQVLDALCDIMEEKRSGPAASDAGRHDAVEVSAVGIGR